MNVATQETDFSKNIELISAAHNGDTDAESRLVSDNIGLVRSIALRFCGRGIELDDLMQIGILGLVKAIRSFDADRGFAFSTYAVPLIMGEIKRTLRDEGLIKVGRAQKKLGKDILMLKTQIMNDEGRDPGIAELAKLCNVTAEDAAMALEAISPVASLSDPIDGDGNFTLESKIPDSENEIEKISDRIALSQAISKLPETQKKILILRFFKGKTQQKTAFELGLSQVKISREERKILEFLKGELI